MDGCNSRCYSSEGTSHGCDCACGGVGHGNGANSPPAADAHGIIASRPPAGRSERAGYLDEQVLDAGQRARNGKPAGEPSAPTADEYGNLHEWKGSTHIVYGPAHSTRHAGVLRRPVTINGHATWGSRIECERCGAVDTQHGGTSVSYEDGPSHFARKHDCENEPGRAASGSGDRLMSVIRQGGASEMQARQVAQTLAAREATMLLEDLREAQRQEWAGVDGADEARRWVTAALVDRIGRGPAGEVERRVRVEVAATDAQRVLSEWDASQEQDPGYGEHPLAEQTRDRLDHALTATMKVDYPDGGGREPADHVLRGSRLLGALDSRLPVYQPTAVRGADDRVPVGDAIIGSKRAGEVCAELREELGVPIVREAVR